MQQAKGLNFLIFQAKLWFQLEDMFQLIVTLQGIGKVMIQLKDTPSKVSAIDTELFLSKVPVEVLQNWVLIQLIVTPHILGKVQDQIKEVCRLIEPCLLIGTREYMTNISFEHFPFCHFANVT